MRDDPADDTRLSLYFAPGIEVTPDGAVLHLASPRFTHRVEGLNPESFVALSRLTTPVAEADLTAEILKVESADGLMRFEALKYQMKALGALAVRLEAGGAPLANFVPMAAGTVLAEGVARAGTAYRLSRFAALTREGDGMVLRTPRTAVRLELLDGRAATAVLMLARPVQPEAMAANAGIPTGAALRLLDMLLAMQAARPEAATEEDDPLQPLGCWEPHDLAFHARTRLGRHDAPFGGTFHLKGTVPPPPLVEPRPYRHDIPLAIPDLDRLRQGDMPFAEVVERRRSLRDYGPPLGIGALGEFLYRSARIVKTISLPEGQMDLSLRPTPGGGAIHELDIYPLVGRCAGLAPGLYHYDALEHALGLVAEAGPATEKLLQIAWTTADRKSEPQIAFTFCARFQRLQWKYQSVAYAVILKNVGALYHSFYLTATAMGLAPCGLGGGTLDLFCKVAGLDPYRESPVGEFMLGSLPEVQR